MYLQTLRKGFGTTGEYLHRMDGAEGRHYCYRCGKLIREGQLFVVTKEPEPFRRRTRSSYRHYEPPEENERKRGD